MNILNDIIIPLLHLILIITTSIYGLVIEKNQIFDFIYFLIIYIILLSWTFLNGECLITYYFKKYQDPDYIAGKELHDDEFKTIINGYDNIIQVLIIIGNLFLIFSVYTVLCRNNISNYMNLTFLIIYQVYFYGLYFFKDHYKNKTFFKFQDVIKLSIIIWTIYLYLQKNYIINNIT